MDFIKIEEVKSKMKKRKKKVNIVFSFIFLGIIVSCFIYGYHIYTTTDISSSAFLFKCFTMLFAFIFFFIPLYLVFLSSCGIIVINELSNLEKEYKEKYVKKYLSESFENLNYKQDSLLDIKSLEKEFYWLTFKSISSYDHFTARYKNIDFEFSNLSIPSEDSPYYYNYYILKSNETFDTKCVISTREESFKYIKFNKVKSHNDEFNKKFYIYVENDKNIDSILTDSLINRIMLLFNQYGKNKIKIAFDDEKIFVSIENSSKLFKFDIDKDVNTDILNEKTINDIKVITSCLDNFIFDDK